MLQVTNAPIEEQEEFKSGNVKSGHLIVCGRSKDVDSTAGIDIGAKRAKSGGKAFQELQPSCLCQSFPAHIYDVRAMSNLRPWIAKAPEGKATVSTCFE